MKKALYILVGIVFLSGAALLIAGNRSEQPLATSGGSNGCPVNDNMLGSFTHSFFDVFDLSVEGGTADMYREGTTLRRMDAVLYGEMGKTDYQYHYLPSGELCAVVETVSHYKKPMSPEVISVERQDFAFTKGALVSWTGTGAVQAPQSPEFVKRGKDIVQLGADILSKEKKVAR